MCVHRFASLLRPGVSGRYPRSERAMGYLEGLSAAAGLGMASVDGEDV